MKKLFVCVLSNSCVKNCESCNDGIAERRKNPRLTMEDLIKEGEGLELEIL